MDSETKYPKPLTARHKCFACYKQFKRKEHLVEHMKISYHSVHQPRCGVCQKHCKSFESVREHLRGSLPKGNCSRIFLEKGCNLCLKVFDSPDSLREHKSECSLSAPLPLEKLAASCPKSQVNTSRSVVEDQSYRGIQAIAVDCEMVAGDIDDICARVCLVDEAENLIFHTYIKPQNPVTNYRYEVTGLTEEHLEDGMSLREVQTKILEILYNGESVARPKLDGGKAKLLVGHSLEHDLNCLRIKYPRDLLRDTAKYRPLMKTNLMSHSLKYLTQTYLGYDIQSGIHDPYEDCVSVMRLYKRMRAKDHHGKGIETHNLINTFDSWKSKELEKMSPEELYEISRSDYRCWCLDQCK